MLMWLLKMLLCHVMKINRPDLKLRNRGGIRYEFITVRGKESLGENGAGTHGSQVVVPSQCQKPVTALTHYLDHGGAATKKHFQNLLVAKKD